MRVDQLMATEVYACRPDDSLERVARLLWEGDCGGAPVCTGDGRRRPVGMITDRDITMCALFRGKPLHELTVAEAMSRRLKACRAEDPIAEAERIMSEARVRRLPVVDREGVLVGMISLADLARQAAREVRAPFREITEEEVGDTLAAICARGGVPQIVP